MDSRLERVGERVRVIVAGGDSIYDGWGANQGLVSTPDGAVVVDTGFTVSASSKLLRLVRRSPSKLRLVVNTHDHSDHVFGNSILQAESPLTLAHTNCRTRLLSQGQKRLEGYRGLDSRLRKDLKGIRITPPQFTFKEDFELGLGGTLIRFIHPKKRAHTVGDTMVYLPDERILFSGDVVWSKYHPNLEDADIQGWLKAIDSIARMKVETIVPGHGPLAGKECLAPLARYLREFDSGMKKLARAGVPQGSVAESLSFTRTEGWKLRPIVPRNVELLYKRYLAKV